MFVAPDDRQLRVSTLRALRNACCRVRNVLSYAASGEVRKQSPNASSCKYCGSSFDGHVGFLIRNIYLDLGFARPWNLRESPQRPAFAKSPLYWGDYCGNDSGRRSADLDLLRRETGRIAEGIIGFMSVSSSAPTRKLTTSDRKRRALTSEHNPCDLHRSEPEQCHRTRGVWCL